MRACLPAGRPGGMLNEMWFVYRITSEKKKYHYLGITRDIKKRLVKHNQGATKSTRPYRPFNKIEVIKVCQNRKEARFWEKYYKSGIGRERLKRGVV